MVWRVNEPAVDGIWPDLTIMLMADPDDVKGRRADSEKDRMDSESLAFQQRVKKGFEAVAERDSDRILRIDAGKSIEEIADEIAAAVERLAGRKI